MSILYEIAGCSNPKRVADVVFVHGLYGDAFKTWKAKGLDANFWPRWLAHDFYQVGVWSLDYDPASLKGRDSVMPLIDRAVNVLSVLNNKGIGARPTIFIVRSMGGVLVKAMLRKASDIQTPEYKPILQNTKGILFLAAPHSGSSVAIEDRKADNSALRDLRDWFRYNHVRLGIKALGLYETRGILSKRIVDEISAEIGVAEVQAIAMNANHVSISKPLNKDSEVHQYAWRFVNALVPEPLREPLPKLLRCEEDVFITNNVPPAQEIGNDDKSDLFLSLFGVVHDCKAARDIIKELFLGCFSDFDLVEPNACKLTGMYDVLGKWDLVVRYRANSRADAERINIYLAQQLREAIPDIFELPSGGASGSPDLIDIQRELVPPFNLEARKGSVSISHLRLASSENYDMYRCQRGFVYVDMSSRIPIVRMSFLRDLIRNINANKSVQAVVETLCYGENAVIIEVMMTCAQSSAINLLNRIIDRTLSNDGRRFPKYTMLCYEYDEN